MKKAKNNTLLIGKIFLVFLMLFSQLYTPMTVFAEELQNNVEESKQIEENTEETNNVVETPNDEEDTKEEQPILEENNQEETTTEENNTSEEEIIIKREIPSEENSNNEKTTSEEENNQEENSDEVAPGTTTDEETSTEQETTPEESSETELKYTVTINDEEVEEYTIKDNKIVTIHQEYNGEEGTYKFGNTTETIDFTQKLYGTYTYNYNVLSNTDEELDSKTITINHNGSNREILEKFNKTATYIMDDEVGIEGTTRKLTVEEVLNNFDNESLQTEYNARLEVRDKDGNVLEKTAEVDVNNSTLILTNDEVEEKFYIYIIGDLTRDGIVDNKDAAKIIEDMLSFDGEEGEFPVSILDATNSKFTTGVWDEYPEVKDTLTNSLVNKTQIYEGEEVEVKYYINGFENDKLSGIQGIVNYNKEILELVDVQIDSIYGNMNDNGKFAYLLDNYQSNDILMTLTFKGISPGEANISIDNILGAYLGTPLNLDDTVSTTITVVELPKGGDVAPEPEETTTQTPSTTTANYYAPDMVYSAVRTVALSSNNLIKSLEIKGYKIDFEPNKLKYAIKVKNDVKKLDLNIILDDERATYVVKGNENFKVGENTVEIIVTAEDGSTRTYTIDVTREKSKKEAAEEQNEKSSKGIIIALIVLVIIGLIYVIFKDDSEEDE